MSASREKKNRQQMQSNPQSAPEAKKGMTKGAKKALNIVIAIAAIAVIVFFAMVTTGFFEAHSTAATVGTRKLSAAEVNYWLIDTYSEEQSAMAYLVDEELPLSEQEYPEEGFETWYDYMLDLALDTASSTYAVYDEAMAEGYTLSDTAKEEIKTQLNNLNLYGSMYGYTNGSAYLSAMYGPGCKTSSYKDYLTVNRVAQEYVSAKFADNTYTAEELDAFYAEHADEVDVISYRAFQLLAETTTDENGDTTVTDEALSAAEEKAIAMAEAVKGDEEKFLELALENTPEDQQASFDADASTQAPNTIKNQTPEVAREWLSDDTRTFGDVYVAENTSGNGFYVFFFQEAIDMDISLPSVRHILVQPEADEEGNISDDAWAEAKTRAEEILAEYEAGEQTEEAFAALADANSSDTGSTGNGGLYENITPGQMVPEFNDWCFSIHNEGDTDVIETSYGYHVMYFVGESLNSYRDVATEAAKRSSDYTAWEEDIENTTAYALKSDKYIIEI